MPFAAPGVAVYLYRRVTLCRKHAGFQDCSNVVVARVGLRLPGCQVAVEETERGIIDLESDDDGSLVPVQPPHAPLHFCGAQVAYPFPGAKT